MIKEIIKENDENVLKKQNKMNDDIHKNIKIKDFCYFFLFRITFLFIFLLFHFFG